MKIIGQRIGFNRSKTKSKSTALIKNGKILEKFERNLIASEKPDHKKNMAVFEAMYKEYRKFARNDEDSLAGIENVI